MSYIEQFLEKQAYKMENDAPPTKNMGGTKVPNDAKPSIMTRMTARPKSLTENSTENAKNLGRIGAGLGAGVGGTMGALVATKVTEPSLFRRNSGLKKVLRVPKVMGGSLAGAAIGALMTGIAGAGAGYVSTIDGNIQREVGHRIKDVVTGK